MPKNDNAHALRLAESLKKNNYPELAEQLETQYPLSKSASIEKKLSCCFVIRSAIAAV